MILFSRNAEVFGFILDENHKEENKRINKKLVNSILKPNIELFRRQQI